MTRHLRFLAIVAVMALALAACNGGLRPTLVDDPPPTPQPELELDIPAAPAGTQPLPIAAPDFPLEASVDDALFAWAQDRAIPYVDSCFISIPAAGELCDAPTDRDTVRLLGPSLTEVWYIVTVSEEQSVDFGVGYRVVEVKIAGS